MFAADVPHTTSTDKKDDGIVASLAQYQYLEPWMQSNRISDPRGTYKIQVQQLINGNWVHEDPVADPPDPPRERRLHRTFVATSGAKVS